MHGCPVLCKVLSATRWSVVAAQCGPPHPPLRCVPCRPSARCGSVGRSAASSCAPLGRGPLQGSLAFQAHCVPPLRLPYPCSPRVSAARWPVAASVSSRGYGAASPGTADFGGSGRVLAPRTTVRLGRPRQAVDATASTPENVEAKGKRDLSVALRLRFP